MSASRRDSVGGESTPPRRLEAIASLATVALSLREAAKALSVSEAHLRNHLIEVPHFHLGGRVLFPLLELHEWARRQAAGERRQIDQEAAALVRSLGSNGE